MEFDALVYKILAPVKGTSARGEWTKQEVVFELPGDFNKKVCVSFWGDKAQDAASLVEGENVTLSVNLESREYNGRWFTEVRAWKVARKAPVKAAPGADLPPFSVPDEEPYSPASAEADDLPF